MICSICKAENPQANRFCGMCGTLLGPADRSPRKASPVLSGYFSERKLQGQPVAGNNLAPVVATSPILAGKGKEPAALEARAEKIGNTGPQPQIQVLDNKALDNKAANGNASDIKAANNNAANNNAANNNARDIAPEKAAPAGIVYRGTVSTGQANTLREGGAGRPGKQDARPIRGIGGPSFLGLSYEPTKESLSTKTVVDPAPSYLLEEESHRSISWRAYALLILLLAISGLLYSQWKSARDRQASGRPDIAAVLASNGTAQLTRNGPGVDTAKPPASDSTTPAAPLPNTERSSSAAEQEGLPNGSQPSSSASSSSSASLPASTSDSTGQAGEAKTKMKTNTAAGAESVQKNQAPPAPEGDRSLENGDNRASQAPARKTAAGPIAAFVTSKAKPAPASDDSEDAVDQRPSPKAYANDPLLIKAQQYLQGKSGHARSCEQGLVFLRSAIAKSNPKAMVQMGALYMSGQCVSQDPVAAYNWFSEAQSLDPYNPWIAKSKSALYASMSDNERHRLR